MVDMDPLGICSSCFLKTIGECHLYDYFVSLSLLQLVPGVSKEVNNVLIVL